MSADDKDSLILRYMEGIPEDLLYIFLPNNEEDLIILEANLLARAVGKRERRDVFDLCRQYNLPVKYRRESVRRTMIAVRILELKKRLRDVQG